MNRHKHIVLHPRGNRSQAALEFMTTYGWALLMVMGMIGALAYFGVIDPYMLLPEKCVFSPGIACKDYVGRMAPGAGTIRAKITNNMGYTIQIQGVTADVSGLSGTSTFTPCAVGNKYCNVTFDGTDWKSDEEREFIVTVPDLSKGDRPRVDISIEYKKVMSTYLKNLTGVINVRPG